MPEEAFNCQSNLVPNNFPIVLIEEGWKAGWTRRFKRFNPKYRLLNFFSSRDSAQLNILFYWDTSINEIFQVIWDLRWKFALKYSWMASLPEIQEPSSCLISEMKFLLFLTKVVRWKNLEFLSPSLSQISLDFWGHLRLSLANQSSNSRLRAASNSRFSLVGSAPWTSTIFFSNSLILSLTLPKYSLLHFFTSFLVFDYFLASLKPCEPPTCNCQALSTTSLLVSSFVHIASNLMADLSFHLQNLCLKGWENGLN